MSLATKLLPQPGGPLRKIEMCAARATLPGKHSKSSIGMHSGAGSIDGGGGAAGGGENERGVSL